MYKVATKPSVPNALSCLFVSLFVALFVIVAPIASSADASDAEPPASARADPNDVEEVIVVGEKVQPSLYVNPVTISRIRDSHGKGARLYRQKRYEEAFPYLLNAAQQGFKLSQARVGYMLHMGLGGVKRDGVAAIGWLGVAASRTTTPEIRDYFRAVMAQVPPEQLANVEKIVAAYEREYGSEKTGFTCNRERQAGSHISVLKCDHKDEYRRDGLDLDGLAEGIANSAGSVTDAP